MSHPASAARRLSGPILGLRASQLIAWQLVALTAVAAMIMPGLLGWALCVVAMAGALLTTTRWQYRWTYEWVHIGWTFWLVGRARLPYSKLALIEVAPVRVRGGGKAAVLYDGGGFAVIVSAEPAAGALQPAALPVDALASLAEPGDTVVSSVQFLTHADCDASGGEPAYGLPARQMAGHQAVPRSQTSWVVLRHDPMASRYGMSAAGTSADVSASLARALAARGQRVVQMLSGHGLQAELLDVDAARAILDQALVSIDGDGVPEGEGRSARRGWEAGGWWTADDGSALRWGGWDNGTSRHVTYWMRRWPDAGLEVLQGELAGVRARSVTTAVTVTSAPDGRLAMTGAVRIALDTESARFRLHRHVHRAAMSCGASLFPLHGEHAVGVLATLPLGRPLRPGRPLAAGRGTPPLATAVPVTAGGLVVGVDLDGVPVAIPLFRVAKGTRMCVAGHPALSRLLALRALGAGARVQVATMRPADWRSLRGHVGVPADLMTIVKPGTPPPAVGSRVAPLLVIDDTGAPAARRGAWQADVTAVAEIPLVPGALAGLDAAMLERADPAAQAAVAAAFSLDDSGRRAIGGIPGGCVAVVLPGSARVVRLEAGRGERAALAASLRHSTQQ